MTMRNCLILGVGRSGTSLTAGLLADAGYHLGDEIFEPTAGNPTGIFESKVVNDLNERLLSQLVSVRPELRVLGSRDIIGGRAARWIPGLNAWAGSRQMWLARVPASAPEPVPSQLDKGLLSQLTSLKSWCYKDPRFAYTLGAWRPYLPPEAVMVCMFRHPSTVATSMIREAETASYLRNLRVTPEWAFKVWIQGYRRVLERYVDSGTWVFLHYEQLLNGEGVTRLASVLETELVSQRIDPRLHRSRAATPAPMGALDLYNELCRRAGYDEVNPAASS